jgi:hypothetical protein
MNLWKKLRQKLGFENKKKNLIFKLINAWKENNI